MLPARLLDYPLNILTLNSGDEQVLKTDDVEER
jgi:hypothetical protein